MKCTLDTIKNHQWMVGSLAAVGLTAAGMVAHRLGLFALCPKGVSDACGHFAAVVSRHRIVSIVLPLAAVGMICLAAVAAVLRFRKGDAPDASQLRTPSSSSSSPLSQSWQVDASVAPKARAAHLLRVTENPYENIEELVDEEYIPDVFGSTQKNWNPLFGTILLAGANPLIETMIVTVLTSYVNGEEIPFCAFFDPAHLTIKPEESTRAQSIQFQQSQLSILPASVETQRMTEYGELLQQIITYYITLEGKEVLPGDSFSYRFEITIGSEKNVSEGYRKLD